MAIRLKHLRPSCRVESSRAVAFLSALHQNHIDLLCSLLFEELCRVLLGTVRVLCVSPVLTEEAYKYTVAARAVDVAASTRLSLSISHHEPPWTAA
jgi:uroporphyrinogen-III synthase